MATETEVCERCCKAPCVCETERVHQGYTRAQLAEAWELIRPESHWKDPIAAWIPARMFKVCAAACEFYTATALRVNCTAGERHDGAVQTRLYVTALGYRRGPAGDH